MVVRRKDGSLDDLALSLCCLTSLALLPRIGSCGDLAQFDESQPLRYFPVRATALAGQLTGATFTDRQVAGIAAGIA